MLLQAYTGVSDADAVEEAQWDMRLPSFRVRMMKHDLDRRLPSHPGGLPTTLPRFTSTAHT